MACKAAVARIKKDKLVYLEDIDKGVKYLVLAAGTIQNRTHGFPHSRCASHEH